MVFSILPKNPSQTHQNPRGGSDHRFLGKERNFLSVALRRTKCPVHLRYWREKHMGVSENRGTPKSSILIGFSTINHPFWGTPIFGIPHICVSARDKQSPRFRAITWQNWTKFSPFDATWCSTVADNLHTSYCWWLKSCTSWGNGSQFIPLFTKFYISKRWLFGISSINNIYLVLSIHLSVSLQQISMTRGEFRGSADLWGALK